jgi:diguanylate cyclase (GGDEF)-like protein/PAS domain S-box-containing protein
MNYREFLEEAPDAFFTHDLAGRITDANRKACESLGYSREELLNMSIVDVEQDFSPTEAQLFWERAKPGENFTFFGRHKRKDGSIFPVEIHMSVHVEGDRKTFLGMVHNITNRKEAERRQERLTKLYRALSEINQAIVRMEKEETLFPLVCRIAVEFGGMSMSWIGKAGRGGRIESVASHGSGLDYLDGLGISASADVPEGRGPSGTAFRENRNVIVNDLRNDPLMSRWMNAAVAHGFESCASFPVFRGEKPFAVFTVYHELVNAFDDETVGLLDEMARDISFALDNFDREKARALALAMRSESERHFRAYFERAMVGMAATSPDMRWLEVNNAMCEILGYTREELLSMTWAELTHPDDLPANLVKFDQLLKGKFDGDGYVIENRFVRKDGRIVYARRAVRVLRRADGSPDYIVAVVEDITERMQAEEALRSSEEKFSTIFHNSPNPTSITRLEDGKILEINEAWSRITGYDRNEAIGRTAVELGIWKKAQDRLAAVEELKHHGRISAMEFVFTNRSGGEIVSLVSAELFEMEGEECVILIAQDITELRHAMETIREQNNFLNAVFDSEPHCVKVVGIDGTLIQMNKAGLAMFEVDTLEEAQRSDLEKFVLPEFRKAYAQFHEYICAGNSGILEFPIAGKKGAMRWLETHATPLRNVNGEIVALLGVTRDITARKQSEELIWKQANFDLLTNLPNRYMFYDRLGQEIRKAHQGGNSLALFFIDLDEFKEVNDTLGHQIGDRLLVEAARRIASCMGESDTIARLGGDEFTVIFRMRDAVQVEAVAQRILDALAEPYAMEGKVGRVYVSASIGITLYPSDALDPEQLLKNADQALYVAKHAGRNRFGYFTKSLQENAQSRRKLLNDLRYALQENEFALYFQPIVDLSSGTIVKAEALLRWKHPVRGIVSPLEFIPLAEETGLIIQIGDWVFREAARWGKLWAARHPDLKISVNMSPLQFRSENTASWLDHLEEVGFSGRNLVIEITEGLLLDADSEVMDRLIEFRDAQIEVAIDDFGTGYSALSYLKKFDIDYLKIDRSFIRDLAENPSDMALSEAIIVMAHKLGLKVIAEGVETAKQLELLSGAGCDYAQGYLFSIPVPADQFEEQLGDGRLSVKD